MESDTREDDAHQQNSYQLLTLHAQRHGGRLKQHQIVRQRLRTAPTRLLTRLRTMNGRWSNPGAPSRGGADHPLDVIQCALPEGWPFSSPRSGTGGDVAPETRADIPYMIEVYYYNITFSELSDEVVGEGRKYGHVPTNHAEHFRSLRRSVTRRRTPTEVRAVRSKERNGCEFVIINRRRYTKMLTTRLHRRVSSLIIWCR